MKRYQVIYADPPWFYNSRSANRITKFGGGARAHYSVMKDDELMSLRPLLDSLADDNCLLAMWATGPRLPFAVELGQKWGFRYATVGFVWNKLYPKKGTPVMCPGFYTSGSTEFVLFFVRGSMRPHAKMYPQFLATPRREHSRKPNEVRSALEKMYPWCNWIELFARETAKGWNAWGNEVTKFNAEKRQGKTPDVC